LNAWLGQSDENNIPASETKFFEKTWFVVAAKVFLEKLFKATGILFNRNSLSTLA
jgi:hypothetical protein